MLCYSKMTPNYEGFNSCYGALTLMSAQASPFKLSRIFAVSTRVMNLFIQGCEIFMKTPFTWLGKVLLLSSIFGIADTMHDIKVVYGLPQKLISHTEKCWTIAALLVISACLVTLQIAALLGCIMVSMPFIAIESVLLSVGATLNAFNRYDDYKAGKMKRFGFKGVSALVGTGTGFTCLVFPALAPTFAFSLFTLGLIMLAYKIEGYITGSHKIGTKNSPHDKVADSSSGAAPSKFVLLSQGNSTKDTVELRTSKSLTA
jgi:hypothetical protein